MQAEVGRENETAIQPEFRLRCGTATLAAFPFTGRKSGADCQPVPRAVTLAPRRESAEGPAMNISSALESVPVRRIPLGFEYVVMADVPAPWRKQCWASLKVRNPGPLTRSGMG
jgi:hypothetical protein